MMTRKERCEVAIQLGYTYNPENGKIYGIYGKEIKAKHKEGYIYIHNSRFQLLGHQFGWFWVNKEVVDCLDHINGIKDDNRIDNLRSVTQQQNHFNIKTVKGYYWNRKANKWKSQIQLNGKNIYLGLFNTEDEAREAYITAKQKLHVI